MFFKVINAPRGLLYLISSQLFSDLVSSSGPISAHLSSSHVLSCLLSSSELISARLGSSLLLSSSHFFSTHLISSQLVPPPQLLLSSLQLFPSLLISNQFFPAHRLSSHPFSTSSPLITTPPHPISALLSLGSSQLFPPQPLSSPTPVPNQISVPKPKKQGRPENPKARWHTAHLFLRV